MWHTKTGETKSYEQGNLCSALIMRQVERSGVEHAWTNPAHRPATTAAHADALLTPSSEVHQVQSLHFPLSGVCSEDLQPPCLTQDMRAQDRRSSLHVYISPGAPAQAKPPASPYHSCKKRTQQVSRRALHCRPHNKNTRVITHDMRSNVVNGHGSDITPEDGCVQSAPSNSSRAPSAQQQGIHCAQSPAGCPRALAGAQRLVSSEQG